MLYVKTHHTRLAEAYGISRAMIKLLMNCTRSSGVWRRSPWCANDKLPRASPKFEARVVIRPPEVEVVRKVDELPSGDELGGNQGLEDGMILLGEGQG